MVFGTAFVVKNNADEWVPLFDGKTLSNWKVGDNAATFTVENGMIVVNGETAHLFYNGDVHQHDFKNFEFKAELMTLPGSNSGIYFHTAYQQGGWPEKGYEENAEDLRKVKLRQKHLNDAEAVALIERSCPIAATEEIVK